MLRTPAPFISALDLMNQKPTRVSGHYVQGSFGLLPLTGERARAALHFAALVGSTSFSNNLELARWYLRASLSEFRSIFDLLNSDLKDLNLTAQWKSSENRSYLEADPIVAILRKIRDFAVHSALVQGQPAHFKVSSADDTGTTSDMPSIVIDQLDPKNTGMHRELLRFRDNEIAEFNLLARQWPADLLIHIAIYRASEPIAGFLKSAQRHEV